jgi:hypothetical protein
MPKKIQFIIPTLILTLLTNNAFSKEPGKFFTITESGTDTAAPVQIILTLNADMPKTRQNYTTNKTTISIKKTPTNKTYPRAGIKIISSGNSVDSGCTEGRNGYCIFFC